MHGWERLHCLSNPLSWISALQVSPAVDLFPFWPLTQIHYWFFLKDVRAITTHHSILSFPEEPWGKFQDGVKSRSIHPNQTQPTPSAAFGVQAESAVLIGVPLVADVCEPHIPRSPLAPWLTGTGQSALLGSSEFTHLLQAFIHPLPLLSSIEEPLYSACSNQI